MKRTIITILIIAVVGVLAFFGYQRYQQMQAAANTNFQTAAVTRGDLTASIGATGTVRSNQTSILNWQTAGKIGQVNVSLGDVVPAGQELAVLWFFARPTANELYAVGWAGFAGLCS